MKPQEVDKIWEQLVSKVSAMAERMQDKSPHRADKSGVYDSMPTWWWTSGFWPGMLWILFDMTNEPVFKEKAWKWDAEIENWLHEGELGQLHHDVGFQFLPTAVIKYILTGDRDGKRIGLAAANFMAGRYNPVGKFIRAWNDDTWEKDKTTGWAIIDCSLNLSLLFWAANETSDPRFKHIATAHADTVLQHFIRPDGSVNHIVSFDAETGAFIESLGGQGFGPHSSWSRGQAWALYGMANTYRYTGEKRFLDAAKRVAHYFVACLPEDGVPYWDFRTPDLVDEPRDSSAGAIAASGLLEIAQLTDSAESRLYQSAAERILASLTQHCGTWDMSEHEAILLNATGHKLGNANVDVSLIYGDYYYVEAMAKLKGWSHRIF